jgi:hypothetical protein
MKDSYVSGLEIRITELEAELARLRPIADLYPLAWEECKKHRWAEMADTEQAAHDQARAKAGVV